MIQDNPQQAGDAYCAGIVDADGCITRSSGNVRVQVTSVDRILCDYFVTRYGGSVYQYQGHNNAGRTIYTWQVSGRTARKVLESIEPYLLLKRNKAFWAIRSLDALPKDRELLLRNLVANVDPSAAAETK